MNSETYTSKFFVNCFYLNRKVRFWALTSKNMFLLNVLIRVDLTGIWNWKEHNFYLVYVLGCDMITPSKII